MQDQGTTHSHQVCFCLTLNSEEMLRPNGILVILEMFTDSETTGWDHYVVLDISSTYAAVMLLVCICQYCLRVRKKRWPFLYYFSVPSQGMKMHHLPRLKPQPRVQALTWSSKLLGAALLPARWLLTTSQLTACSYPCGSAPPSQQGDAAVTCSQSSHWKGNKARWGYKSHPVWLSVW